MKRWFLIVSNLILFFSAVTGQAQERVLTLDQCVETALENNPDLIRGEFTMKIAGRDVVIAMSNFLPSVSGSLGYYHSVIGPSSNLRIDPGTGIPVPVQPNEITSWSSTARLTVNQDIFSGGYNYFNLKRSMDLKKSAEESLENTRQLTIYVTKERYYNLLKAEKLLEVAEETVRSAEESYKRAQVLYEVGKAPRSDVLKAKVQMETDRLSLIEAQNSLSIAQASLNHVLGFNVDEVIRVVDNLDVPEMEVSYQDARAQAFSTHPQLLMSRYELNAAGNQVGMAVSQYIPKVSAYYQYSWSHEDFGRINDIFDKDYNWYAGLSLSIPIFQGFSRYAQVSQARLSKKSYEEAHEQVKRDVALEVKQAWFLVQQAKKKIAVAQNAVESADEDLRLNKEKYSLGAGTMLDLINAQVSATQAKSEHIQSLYDYKYAIARLQKAMGRLEH